MISWILQFAQTITSVRSCMLLELFTKLERLKTVLFLFAVMVIDLQPCLWFICILGTDKML